MPKLRVAPGTFITWHRGGVHIGRSSQPFQKLQRGPFAAGILTSFSESHEERDVVEEFTVEDRPVIERLIAELKAGTYLVDADSVPGDYDAPGGPSSLKSADFEIGRFVDVFPDIQVAEPQFMAFYETCRKYTLLSVPLLYSLYSATRHVVAAGIEGDIVECGVWRGGSLMLSALTLDACKDTARTIFLYDTFEATWETPLEKDGCVYLKESYRATLTSGKDQAQAQTKSEGFSVDVSEENVAANLRSTGYPAERIVTVKGLVQDTIPSTMPDKIALLRLDTDFFDSTYHELVHLYPRLVPNGVLIIDDYGKHRGAMEATDKYFAEHGVEMLLHRVDVQGRIGIKPAH